MITQDEHTARHSTRGACGSPAGSGWAGGLFFYCRDDMPPSEKRISTLPPVRISETLETA